MVKKVLFSLLLLAALLLPVGGVAAQDPFGAICDGVRDDSSVCKSENTYGNPLFGPAGVITRVVQLLVIFAGVASVIMIMVGGFKYITSSGDPSKTASAKNTILFAVIGLVVTVLSQTIVTFVLLRL